MYPQYPPPAFVPQYDPMRVFFYGCLTGFVFAFVLIFGVLDVEIFPAKNSDTPPNRERQVQNRPIMNEPPTYPSVKIDKQGIPNVYSNDITSTPNDWEYDAVIIDPLKFRELPNIESVVIRDLQLNELVQILERTPYTERLRPHHDGIEVDACWYKVKAKYDGKIGWVFGSAVVGRRR